MTIWQAPYTTVLPGHRRVQLNEGPWTRTCIKVTTRHEALRMQRRLQHLVAPRSRELPAESFFTAHVIPLYLLATSHLELFWGTWAEKVP